MVPEFDDPVSVVGSGATDATEVVGGMLTGKKVTGSLNAVWFVCYILRASYAQCRRAWRCFLRQDRSPFLQFFFTCPRCRRIAFHRLICLSSSSGMRRPE